MREIEVTGIVGVKTTKLWITRSTGSGEVWHIYIDDYYNGQILENAWGRTWHLNPQSTLTSDDIAILNDILDKPGSGHENRNPV